jgi:hypothetical protein
MNRSAFGVANLDEGSTLIVFDVDKPQIRIESDFARHPFRDLVEGYPRQVANEHAVAGSPLLEETLRGRSVEIVQSIAAVDADEHGTGFVCAFAGDGNEGARRLGAASERPHPEIRPQSQSSGSERADGLQLLHQRVIELASHRQAFVKLEAHDRIAGLWPG